ncbi:MAG TPA: glycosyltransferase family 4 protein [Candidatus Angelobacter sp.]|nr:glycosyltransferase family 4 protein [Candidatus Angelobacter sp.]
MKILVLANLYPPHHAGTYDLRCQSVTESLRLRGHSTLIATSNHGLNTEQRDEEVHRRLLLNGAFGHPLVAGFRELQTIEEHNNGVLQEAIAEFQPDLAHVWSLRGLSKSLIFSLRNSRLPTVYDIADRWLADDLRQDPWLRWWNAPGTNLARTGLELAGRRNRLDETAPTRMMRGLDRIPEVYGPPAAVANVPPNSVSAFRFDRLYFCSRALKQTTEESGFRVSHGEIIYPGVPVQHFVGEIRPPSAPVKRLLIVGRLDEYSGVMAAAQALLRARQNKAQVTLSVFGRGESDYVSQLRSFVVQNSLPVEFLTVSNQNRDLAAIYRQHDALLYPVEWEEPFATVPLEAMACGLPVIGAAIGGARELLRHGENALTFTPGDAEEMAARIQELQAQPALRCQMAETAQAEVLARYNETTVVDQIENYLNTSIEVWQHT